VIHGFIWLHLPDLHKTCTKEIEQTFKHLQTQLQSIFGFWFDLSVLVSSDLLQVAGQAIPIPTRSGAQLEAILNTAWNRRMNMPQKSAGTF
jgi:hypothetical protein